MVDRLRWRHRRYACTLCGRDTSVAHFLRHLEAHRRQAVIDHASIRREWQRFQDAEAARG